MGNSYTLTHLHSDLSSGVTNIDSITKYDEYIERAKELGMKAMAFTEHGSVFSWVNKKKHIEAAGMKYIHGEEFYVTETLDEKIRDNYHCCLYARNYSGVEELNYLSSIAFNRKDGHFYYVPRITFQELLNTSDNIIISTACLGGILNKGNENIRERFLVFLTKNKHRCFLEIQHHNVEEQIAYNRTLYEIHKATGVPLIAGTDTHALNAEHLEGRAILQKSKKVLFADEEKWDLSMKTYDELIEAYRIQNAIPYEVALAAIENTNILADMIEEFNLDKSYKYPHLWEDSEKVFMDKISAGIKRRGVDKYPNYDEYLKRIDHELEAYKHNGAIDFMLLMEDIISWCISQEIYVGYGRGSVNGSVIAWLLGITEMDSIKHGLNFERFMNVERVSLSDIDTDFPPSRIEEVKQHIFNMTGLYCCDIITFNTIADKGAIRDVGRALNIPLDTVAKICSAVDSEEEYAKVRDKYKELFKYVDLVKGTIVSIGSHPCGCVVSPEDVAAKFGTCTTSTSSYPISQIYMKEIDGLNYVKLDLLRLDTIELINETCKLAGIERLTPDNIDVNDVAVWNSMRDDTTQIFQWEGNTGESYIKKLLSDENIKKFQTVNENVDRMTLLSIGNSAIRPAGASYRDDLASGVVRKTGSDVIDEFLKPTFGYLVFQCQIIDFLHQYCGFTMGEADTVRRHFAKKTGTEADIPVIKDGGYIRDDNGVEKREHYIKGFTQTMKEKYDMPKEVAEKTIVDFLQVIIDASRYLFSLNHSSPYSYEGYASGWLRYYYPLEFLTVALKINQDKEDKTKGLTEYARKCSISFKAPKFRYSKSEYFLDKNENAIYKGIGSLKYMNNAVADELFEMRDVKFGDFIDVLYYLYDKTSIDSRQLDILIKIDFFSEFGDINELIYITEKFNLVYGKKSVDKHTGLAKLGISEEFIRPFAEKESFDRVDDIDISSFLSGMGFVPSDIEDCMKNTKCKDDLPTGYSLKKIAKKFDLTDEELMPYATKIVHGKFTNVDFRAMLKNLIRNANVPYCTMSDKMKYQFEHLGYIEYVNSNIESGRYVVVTDLDTKYSPKFKAYCLKTGDTCEMKIHSRKNNRDKSIKVSFADLPLENGDIIYMTECDRKPKQRKNSYGEWEAVPGEFSWWIKDYRKINKDEEVLFLS